MSEDIAPLLARIAAALERLAPAPPGPADLSAAHAFVWGPSDGFRPVDDPAPIPLALLQGMEAQKEELLANTRRFAEGLPANNALLWGARGTGKSALVKAVHAAIVAEGAAVKLVEAALEDLTHVRGLLAALAGTRTILFLDDLAFEGNEAGLKALKPALAGGLGGGPSNVIVYATSNRRHLLARDPRENSPTDLHWRDAAEERLAAADRFGLSLGFHPLDQDAYLRIVTAYADHFGVPASPADALEWAALRGARSGRTAWQFIISKIPAPV